MLEVAPTSVHEMSLRLLEVAPTSIHAIDVTVSPQRQRALIDDALAVAITNTDCYRLFYIA